MRIFLKWSLVLGWMLSLLAQAAPTPGSDAHSIRLSSLQWAPYTGEALPQQGAITAVVRAALAAVGYRLEVGFFPFSRAVAMVDVEAGDFIGYFPEYFAPVVARNFLLSDSIGSGPLGLVERVDRPIRWRSLEDLSAYRIGVVQDYQNTEAFDRRVRENLQAVDIAPDDAHNLLKVAAGRIPLAVVDRRVFDYLARHDPKVKAVASQLRFNPRLLEEKRFYICFRRDAEGERVRELVNRGLKRIDVDAVMADALR